MNGSKSTFIPSNQFLVYHFQATENKRTKIDIFFSKIEITFDLWNSVFGFKWKLVSVVCFSLHFTNIFFSENYTNSNGNGSDNNSNDNN